MSRRPSRAAVSVRWILALAAAAGGGCRAGGESSQGAGGALPSTEPADARALLAQAGLTPSESSARVVLEAERFTLARDVRG